MKTASQARPIFLVFAIAISLLFSGVTAASAHSDLTSANPKQKSVVTVFPKQVILKFNEELIKLEPGNRITVTDPKGKAVHSGKVSVAGKQLSIALRTSKVLGKYRVTYRAISADGHPITGKYEFTLRAKAKK